MPRFVNINGEFDGSCYIVGKFSFMILAFLVVRFEDITN